MEVSPARIEKEVAMQMQVQKEKSNALPLSTQKQNNQHILNDFDLVHVQQ